MTSEILAGLAKANLAAAAAILIVLALRWPAARLFGARVRYLLWALVPAVTAASFVPAARLTTPPPSAHLVIAPAIVTGVSRLAAATPPVDISPLLTLVWIAGLLVSLIVLATRQRAFVLGARLGEAGPAVIGFLRPKIHLPPEFSTTFTAAEQDVILAHEQVHLRRQDPRVNGLVALARCLCWFNPLVHLAAHLARLDQETACDEAVVARHPGRRRAYARAMLKTQLASLPLPLGCYWPASEARVLEERIAMLKLKSPAPARRLAGATLVAALTTCAGYSAWATQPPQPALTPHLAWASAPTAAAADPAAAVSPLTTVSPVVTKIDPPLQLAQASPPATAPAPVAPATVAVDATPNLKQAILAEQAAAQAASPGKIPASGLLRFTDGVQTYACDLTIQPPANNCTVSRDGQPDAKTAIRLPAYLPPAPAVVPGFNPAVRDYLLRYYAAQLPADGRSQVVITDADIQAAIEAVKP